VDRRFPAVKPIKVLLGDLEAVWRDCLGLMASPPGGFELDDESVIGKVSIETLSEGSIGDETDDADLPGVFKRLPLKDDLVEDVSFRFYCKYRKIKPPDAPKGWHSEWLRRTVSADFDQDGGARVSIDGEAEWVQRALGSIVDRVRGLSDHEQRRRQWALGLLPLVVGLIGGAGVAIQEESPALVAIGLVFGALGSFLVALYFSDRPTSVICIRERLPDPTTLEQLARAVPAGVIAGAIIAALEILFLGRVI
jgi:hypothetical protein